MEIRNSYWYSIIKYVADFTKGEFLNIGIFIEESEKSTVKYSLLEPDNIKFKAAFENKLQKDVYRYGKDYFDYLISQIKNDQYPITNISENLTHHLAKGNDLPKGFVLSEPQYAKTSNVEQLMSNLQVTYIGEKFVKSETATRELVIKEKASSILSEAKLLNYKIKTNVKIAPSPTLPFKYQIDFAYRVNNNIDLIQSAPGNIELLPDWFEKINVLSTNYTHSDKISLLYDSNVDSTLLSDTKSAIRILTEADSKIKAIDISQKTNGMHTLIDEIKSSATDIDELEKLIAM